MSKNSSPGCGCGCTTWIICLIINMLIGGLATQYCLHHWLPVLHNAYPNAINIPGQIKLWPWCVILGIPLGEFFIPGAIITWVLIGMGIIH